MNRKYSPKHIEFIRMNITGCHFVKLTDMFNKQFGMSLTVAAMISLADRHGLHNGIDCKVNKGYEPSQFKKGHVPFNKGKKKYWIGGEETQFKKGNTPHNHKPVGAERVNGDDYIDIKIAEPNKWKGKHILAYEEINGPIPKGYNIIFGDGNNRNFDTSNLILVSKNQLLQLNRNKLIQKDADLTRIGVAIADIKIKIASIQKNN